MILVDKNGRQKLTDDVKLTLKRNLNLTNHNVVTYHERELRSFSIGDLLLQIAVTEVSVNQVTG